MTNEPLVSLEQEFRLFFEKYHLAYADNSATFEHVDFRFEDRKRRLQIYLDAKEKRQRYSLQNWPVTGIPEEHAFIIDDLAARKLLYHAPTSGMIVRDNVRPAYYFFSIVDLFLMPRHRVNRPIGKQVLTLKGKWLIDLRNGRRCDSLYQAFLALAAYLDAWTQIFTTHLECYGSYRGETIGRGGIVRQPGHWDTDVKETR